MEARHSKGPWAIDCAGPNDFLVMENDSFIPIRDSQPRRIGFVSVWNLDENADEEFANARLIAAAPDLLAALESARDALEQAQGDWAGVTETFAPEWTSDLKYEVEKIDKVIAKVRGTADPTTGTPAAGYYPDSVVDPRD